MANKTKRFKIGQGVLVGKQMKNMSAKFC